MFNQRFILKSDGDDVQEAQQILLKATEDLDFDDGSRFAVRLALEEALSNAFKHGNKNDPGKVVRMECSIEPGTIIIDIEDEGDGFDPNVVPDPTLDENLEIPSGRGIVLMKSFMSEVQYEPPGNRVRLTFKKQ